MVEVRHDSIAINLSKQSVMVTVRQTANFGDQNGSSMLTFEIGPDAAPPNEFRGCGMRCQRQQTNQKNQNDE